MPVDDKSVYDALNEEVTAQQVVTNTSVMSPFWRLVRLLIITPYLWIVDTLINRVLKNLFLQTAEGQFVDLFAADLNLTRKTAVAARGVLRFTSESREAVVKVPGGTVVQTERINGTVYSMKTVADAVIPAGSTSALIEVVATEPGAGFNLAPGYYQILPQEVAGVASVNNGEGWLTSPGADQETDAELKDRCRNQFNLAGNYHTDAVYRSMIAAQAGLSIDRIFFQHDAPRGPGTANAYLLLDTGVISQPYLDVVNKFITADGHHGHGDDMQCYAMPETLHDLDVTLYVVNLDNLPQADRIMLTDNAGNLIRCAFRENANFDVQKTWPWSRFSFSRLGQELHDTYPQIASVQFSLADIISGLDIPRLKSLTVRVANA